MAGTNPIAGATVQLFAAGNTGNGLAPTALLPTPITTSAIGAFSIPETYTCPSAASELYLLATGGAPVLTTTVPANPTISLIAILGRCDVITAGSTVIINEVTTVAAVWAMSQFLAAGGNIGASATNVTGLANAAATATSLANTSTGTSPGGIFPANGASPARRINTLANLLNTCTTPQIVTSTSTTTPPVTSTTDRCPTFLAAATPTGAAPPTNTLDAALDLIRNPDTDVATLFTQSQLVTAFSPALATAPSDWTLPIHFTGAGMNAPSALGVDSTGSIWVANYFGVASKFSPIGLPVFASGISGYGLNDSYGLAIDAKDNVWIPNEESSGSVNNGFGSVTVLNAAGQPVSGTTGYSTGGFNYPIAIAIDTDAVSWVVDYGNSHLTTLSSTGQPLSGTTGYTPANLAFPVAVLVDGSHNAWIANQSTANITRVSPDGTQSTSFACCNGASGLALDQRGNIWVANYYGDSISQVSTTTAGVISTGYTGGGIDHPQGLAIDGTGNLWVANYRGTSLTELAGAASLHPGMPLSPATGWAPDANLLEAYAIAIDASGNLWVTNFGKDTLTEFVGIAAPVKTPLLGPPQSP